MSTSKKTQYEYDEEIMLSRINDMMERYNLDLKEVIDVIWDQLC